MRPIDADYIMSAFGIFTDKEHGNEHFLYGIETAKEIVANAPTVGGWISVKDRLPDTSGLKVIVSAKTTSESVLQTKAVFVAFLGYGDWKWYTPDVDFMASAKTGNDNVHPVWEITHWMLMPEPPKEMSGDADIAD